MGQSPRNMETPFSGDSVLPRWSSAMIASQSLSEQFGRLLLAFRQYSNGLMQASSQNQLAAFYSAIPVKSVGLMVWGLVGHLRIAGVLLAPVTLVSTLNGFLGVKALPRP